MASKQRGWYMKDFPDFPVKFYSVVTWKDRLLFAWFCIIGRVFTVAIIIPKKEFYEKGA
jgi:hypothetical protein